VSLEAASSSLVSLEDVRAAARRLGDVALRTPLVPYEAGPAHASTRPLYLKLESLQVTGSFKLRGAFNAVAALPEAVRARGVVAHSSGNHGYAVGYAARHFGVRAVVVMPSDASDFKLRHVQSTGAEIVLVGPSSDERSRAAAAFAEREGLALVPSADDLHVIAGQGTIGLEILDALQDRDVRAHARRGRRPPLTVLVPIGGGGLASGVAVAVKALAPDAAVVGVEPELAADARASLRTGRLTRWEPHLVGRTIADGLRLTSLAPLAWEHLKRHVDDVVPVAEHELERAVVLAASTLGVVVEPSGAPALAAALYHDDELPPADALVCVLSGRNIAPRDLQGLIARSESAV
jgi:threonine dehydratase